MVTSILTYTPGKGGLQRTSLVWGPIHTNPEIFVSANFFMRIQKYLCPHVPYTNRIRPSTRIRFVSGHLKGLVNTACALRLVLILWRQRIQKYTDTSVHTYPDTQRIQKFPLWRAYTEILGYTERIRRTRVDAMCIRIKKKLRIQKSPDTCGRGLNRVELSVICSLINLKWI